MEFYNGTKDFNLPNGDSYSGEYCAHVSGLIWREGHGIYKTQDGQTYEGLWRDDKLVAGPNVKLNYTDGCVYNGPIIKNKYMGSGSFKLPSGLMMYSEFDNNLPKRQVVMSDLDGKMWHGLVENKQVNFSPENIFFNSIPTHRGIRKEHLKNLCPEFSPEIDYSVEEESTAEPIDWESIVFAKSQKTNATIDFNDSPWYKEYLRYKKIRGVVLEKVRRHSTLREDEAKWYAMYVRYKRLKRKAGQVKNIKREVDTSLLDMFYSRQFAESSKPYKVFYPMSRIVESGESECSEEGGLSDYENVLPVGYGDEEELEESEEMDQLEETAEPDVEAAGRENIALGTDSLYDFIEEVLQTKIVRKCN